MIFTIPILFSYSSDPELVIATCILATVSSQYLDVINTYKNLYALLETGDTSYAMDVNVEQETTDVSTSPAIIGTPDQSFIPSSVSSSLTSRSSLSYWSIWLITPIKTCIIKPCQKKHRRKQERKKKKKKKRWKKKRWTATAWIVTGKPDVC